MIYNIIKFLQTINFKFVFKQVREINKYRMPKKGPAFVACNHVNAFIDPMVVGKYYWTSFWFVARGDIFKKKFAAWLLNKMHILPIHRKQDDTESSVKNEGAMRDIVNKFVSGKRIVIYPEGICIQERRLRPLRKGTARMAFAAEAENNFKLNAQIICVGLNYNRPNQFGAEIDVVYGKSFFVNEYKELYYEDTNKAIAAFNKRLQEELTDLMIIVTDKQNDALFNILDIILINDLTKKNNIAKHDYESIFKLRKNLAHKINQLTQNHSGKIIELRDFANKYNSLLKQYNIRDWVVKKHIDFNLLTIISSIFIFCISLPLFLFGLIHHYFQYILAYKIAKKVSQNVEFFSSINYNSGMFLMLFSYILFFSIAILIDGFSYYSFAYIILVPISGIFTHFFSLYLKKIKGRLRFNSFKNTAIEKEIIESRNVLKNYALEYLNL